MIGHGSLRENISQNQTFRVHTEACLKRRVPCMHRVLSALEGIPYSGSTIKHLPFLTIFLFSDSMLVKKTFKNLVSLAVYLLMGSWLAIFSSNLRDDCEDHPDMAWKWVCQVRTISGYSDSSISKSKLINELSGLTLQSLTDSPGKVSISKSEQLWRTEETRVLPGQGMGGGGCI